jgi:hypothetical protein
VTGWGKYLWYRLGYRGLFLVILGVQDIAFGVFLRSSDRPEYLRFLIDVNRVWWLLWTACGLFLFTGALRHPPLFCWLRQPKPAPGRYDRAQYAAAVAVKAGFAAEYVRLAFLGSPQEWALAAFWITQLCLVMAASAWPDP